MPHYFLEWLLQSCLPWYIGMPTILLGYWYTVSLWCQGSTELCNLSHNSTFVTLEGCIINWSSLVELIWPLVLPASSITCVATTGLLLCQLHYLFSELSYLLCLVSSTWVGTCCPGMLVCFSLALLALPTFCFLCCQLSPFLGLSPTLAAWLSSSEDEPLLSKSSTSAHLE